MREDQGDAANAERDLMFSVAVQGFKRSAERVSEVEDRLRRPEPELLIALSETLFWACGLDEQLWRLGGYGDRRDADEWGCVLSGLRHARNLAAHRVLLTTEHAPAPFRPRAGAVLHIGTGLVWRPLEDLADPGPPAKG